MPSDLVSLRALLSAPLAAADAGPDALQRFFIGEEPRMDALVWRHRVYVALHNIGFLLGILLVILRLYAAFNRIHNFHIWD